MMKLQFLLLIILILSTHLGCDSEAQNYKDAYLITRNDSTFIKLRGKRVRLHASGTYEDSTLIPIIDIRKERIPSEDLPVEKGYYSLKGFITINKDILKVHLLVDDTGDKKLRPLPWNGTYHLIK